MLLGPRLVIPASLTDYLEPFITFDRSIWSFVYSSQSYYLHREVTIIFLLGLMCDICIGGLHIPYSALLPILIFVFQWMSAQLSKFFGLKSLIAVSPDSTKAPILLKNRRETRICNEMWCFCRKLRKRFESNNSSEPRLIYEPLLRSESSDSEESMTLRRASREGLANQIKFPSITTFFIPPPGSREFCMPCT